MVVEVLAHKILPFDFSPCSSDRDRNSSGLCSVETVCVVELPNEPHFCSFLLNSSFNRFAKLMASDPHTVWCIPIGIGFETRAWRGFDTILGGSDSSLGSSPCPKDRLNTHRLYETARQTYDIENYSFWLDILLFFLFLRTITLFIDSSWRSFVVTTLNKWKNLLLEWTVKFKLKHCTNRIFRCNWIVPTMTRSHRTKTRSFWQIFLYLLYQYYLNYFKNIHYIN